MDSLKQKIHIIIPSQTDPKLVVRHRDDGLLPSFDHDRHKGTYEEQLHNFGRTVLGIVVSVTRAEISEIGERLYHTKPVNHSFAADSPYQWQ